MSHCYCGFPLPLSEDIICEECSLHLTEIQRQLVSGKKIGDGIVFVKLVEAFRDKDLSRGMTLADKVDRGWFRMKYRYNLIESELLSRDGFPFIPSVILGIVEDYLIRDVLIEVEYRSHDDAYGGDWCYGFCVDITVGDDVHLRIRYDESPEGSDRILTYSGEELYDSLESLWSKIESINLIFEFGDKAREMEKLHCINELIQCLRKDLWEFRRKDSTVAL